MSIPRYVASVLLLSSLDSLPRPAQQPAGSAQPTPSRITLDVVVTPKSGAPVTGLQKSDFTLLDNKAARPIATFDAFSGPQAPIEIVLLIDAVNTNFTNLAYERQQIDTFLRANGGHLAHPDRARHLHRHRHAGSAGFLHRRQRTQRSLRPADIGLREIRRDSRFWGAEDRLKLSLNALQLLTDEGRPPRPGRKIIFWVSPGWPYLSGPSVDLDAKQNARSSPRSSHSPRTPHRRHHSLQHRSPRLRREHRAGNLLPELPQGRHQAQPGPTRRSRAAGARRTEWRPRPGRQQRHRRPARALHGRHWHPITSSPSTRRRPSSPTSTTRSRSKSHQPGLTARTRTGYYARPDLQPAPRAASAANVFSSDASPPHSAPASPHPCPESASSARSTPCPAPLR